jgi:alpha-amylase
VKISVRSVPAVLLALLLWQPTASFAARGTVAGKVPPKPAWSKRVGVMLQGFHWNSASNIDTQGVPWYDVVQQRAPQIGQRFDAIWMPPASKAAVEDVHGPRAQGYLPYSLMNFKSDYGSPRQLKQTLASLRQHGVMPVADIVLNHISPRPFIKNDGMSYQLDLQKDRFQDLGVDGIVKESGGLGAPDTGQRFTLVADVDHTNRQTKRTYGRMLNALAEAGFEGTRYDFAKGFSPRTIGLYNRYAKPKFSVAELWEDFHDPDSHREQMLTYIQKTGNRTAMFDFTTKAVLQDAVAKGEYWRLRDANGRAAGLLGIAPEYAVTFVDNHDTGSSPGGNGKGGQRHWEFPGDRVMQGYAYILTHPGIPTVYWPHYFDWQSPNRTNTMKVELDALIDARKQAGVDASSPLRILAADNEKYAAMVRGSHGVLAMKIGPGSWEPPHSERWTLVTSGESYAVWRAVPRTPRAKVATASAK